MKCKCKCVPIIIFTENRQVTWLHISRSENSDHDVRILTSWRRFKGYTLRIEWRVARYRSSNQSQSNWSRDHVSLLSYSLRKARKFLWQRSLFNNCKSWGGESRHGYRQTAESRERILLHGKYSFGIRSL